MAPNLSLYYYEGVIQLPDGQQHGLTIDNFLPRGATMQGAGDSGVLALVAYTGKDTKLVLN